MLIDNAYRRYPSGREVCEKNDAGWAEYRQRVEHMWMRQHEFCGLCWQRMTLDQATFEHEDLRGAGGARRDDRVVDDNGRMMNLAAHRSCNGEKGSRRELT